VRCAASLLLAALVLPAPSLGQATPPGDPPRPDAADGDINRDGACDVGDVVRLVEIINGAAPTPEEAAAADCNGDGAIDTLDIDCLTKRSIGIPTSMEGSDMGLEFRMENFEPMSGFQFSNRGHPVNSTLGSPGWKRVAGWAGAMAFTTDGRPAEPGVWSVSTSLSSLEAFRAYGPGGVPLPVLQPQGGRIQVGARPVGIEVGTPLPIRLLRPDPNPFPGSTHLRFETGPGLVDAYVRNMDGYVVDWFQLRVREEGVQDVVWPGPSINSN